MASVPVLVFDPVLFVLVLYPVLFVLVKHGMRSSWRRRSTVALDDCVWYGALYGVCARRRAGAQGPLCSSASRYLARPPARQPAAPSPAAPHATFSCCAES
jgi:hypothetical protein